jgi:hypothetical protein
MSITFNTVLNLPTDFTIEDLNNAFQQKLNAFAKSGLSDVDQTVYKESLKKYYVEAKQHLHNKELFSYNRMGHFPLFGGFSGFGGLGSLTGFQSPIDSLFLDLNSVERPYRNEQIYSSSSSYREQLMPDGTRLVLRETNSNDNGNITRNTKSYRRLQDGKTEPIEFEDALKQIDSRKYLM